MATDVNVFAVKEQIVDILDSNSTLFDATGANDKVRKITVGAPRMSRLVRETTLPQIWVTNETVIDDLKQSTATQGNAPKTTTHTLHFKIILLADAKDGPKAEEILDDFVKLINEDITENYDLRQPAGAESTSIVDNCVVNQVSEFPNLAGLAKAGRFIKLKAVATTG